MVTRIQVGHEQSGDRIVVGDPARALAHRADILGAAVTVVETCQAGMKAHLINS